MIYDYFLFFNELDILDIRLHELDPVVDYFVLVESTHTFSGVPKPLIFDANRHKFQKFANKILYLRVGYANSPHPFENEAQQRDAAALLLTQIGDQDIVMISDVDEIPKASIVKEAAQTSLSQNASVTIQQSLSFYYLNNLCTSHPVWPGTTLAPKRIFQTAQILRNGRLEHIQIQNGGWHFSYCGDIAAKIAAFSHQELNRPEILSKIPDAIANNRSFFDTREFEPQPLSFCPDYVQQNSEKFQALITRRIQ